MFVEERVYRLKPGCIPEYFDLYARKGLGPQRRYLKAMLGYYASELGELNEVVHLWAHETLDAREENRANMRAIPSSSSTGRRSVANDCRSADQNHEAQHRSLPKTLSQMTALANEITVQLRD